LATAALRDPEDDESQREDPEPSLSEEQILALETSLRNELLSVFTALGLQTNTAAHSHISECISDTDNIAVMSYPTFNNFMNQRRAPARNGLKPQFRKGLQAYVSKHTALLAALATAAVQDSEDDESQCDDP
jgi:hypothetical protein